MDDAARKLWHERIDRYFTETSRAVNPITVLSLLLDRQIVTNCSVEWQGRLALGFEINEKLPDVPDVLVPEFLSFARGQPTGLHFPNPPDPPAAIVWPTGDWTWTFCIDAGGGAIMLTATEKLVEHLPGDFSGSIRLYVQEDEDDDEGQEVVTNLKADGERLTLTAVSGATSITTVSTRQNMRQAFIETFHEVTGQCCEGAPQHYTD